MLKKQTLMIFNSALAALLCCLISIAPSAAANGTYGPREVEYVTDSRNSDVVFYVICLEREVGNTPRSMKLADALTSAERACRSLARRLPNRRSEPSASQLRQAVLDCGFTAAGATRGKRCGSRNSGNNSGNNGGGSASNSSQADNVVLRPKVYRLGSNVKGMAYDGTWLWAAESGQRSIAKIDLDRGRYVERVNIGRAPQHVVSNGNGNTFTTLANDKSIWRQRSSGRGSNLADLHECPVSMVADGRSVWVLTQPDCDDRSSRLMKVNARSGRIDESDVLEEQANDLVARRNQIWVAHSGSSNLTIINQRNMRDTTLRIRRAKFTAIAGNRDHIFAAGSGQRRNSDGLVVMIDPDSEKEIERVELPEKVAHITVDGDYVIAVGEEGTIWILSTDDLELLRTITVRSGSFTPGDVLVENDLLLVSVDQYRRRDGALFAFNDWKPDSRSGGGNSGGGSAGNTGGNSGNNSGNNSGGGNSGGGNANNGGTSSIFPVRAGSSGGRVRSGPGTSYGQVGSLQNGEHVTLLEKTNVVMNGFPWFEIQFRGGQNGYQWGGILCETRNRVPGINGRCRTRSTNNNQGNSGNSGNNNNNSGNNGNSGNQGNSNNSGNNGSGNNNSGNNNSGNQNIDLNNVLGAIIGVVGAIQDHKQQKKNKKKQKQQRALNSCHLRGSAASTSSGRAPNIQFTNVGNTDLHIYWSNFQGNEGNFSNQRQPIVTLSPGTSRKLDGFVGYSFVILDSSSNCVDVLKIKQKHTQFAIASGAKTTETNNRTVRKKITKNSSCNLRGNVVSTSTGQNAKLSITNNRQRDINVFWISYSGQEENYGGAARPQVTIAPGNVANIDAFVGFKFVATNKRGRCLGLNEISRGNSHFEFR